MKITAKEIRAAAASVAGARGMGIETAASRAAPELLARAEAALRAISGRADDEAVSQSGGRLAAQADALESAVRELREALGVAAEECAKPAAESPAEPQPEEAGVEVDFEPAWEETCRMYGECYDQNGRRVAMFVFRHEYDGRMSSLGGWNPGGSAPETVIFAAEDGRELADGERVSVRETSAERELQRGRLYLAGVIFIPKTSATSEWHPAGTPAPLEMWSANAAPLYRSDWDCAAAWDEAFEERRTRRAAEKEAAKAPAEPAREWTLADLAALSSKRKRA